MCLIMSLSGYLKKNQFPLEDANFLKKNWFIKGKRKSQAFFI